jgi:hypothetical protein
MKWQEEKVNMVWRQCALVLGRVLQLFSRESDLIMLNEINNKFNSLASSTNPFQRRWEQLK